MIVIKGNSNVFSPLVDWFYEKDFDILSCCDLKKITHSWV